MYWELVLVFADDPVRRGWLHLTGYLIKRFGKIALHRYLIPLSAYSLPENSNENSIVFLLSFIFFLRLIYIPLIYNGNCVSATDIVL